MTESPPKLPRWWAQGLLFENCSCQAICPGHVHFDQLCTRDRCVGYWATRFDEGDFDGTALGGLSAVIAYDSPQHMIEGGWTEVLIIDEKGSPDQRNALEAILSGTAGGPWAVLARFVGQRLPTRYGSVRIQDGGKTKKVSIPGLLESTVEAIRGRDRSKLVTFENMFNQLHAPSQIIATGTSRYDDGTIVVETDKTHGLFSHFHWSVTPR